MVALLLTIIIGIHFHTLAQKHNENEWIVILMGLLVYTIPFLILILFTSLTFFSTGLNFVSTLELIAIPTSIVLCYILRRIFISMWENKEYEELNNEIIDDIKFD